MADTSADSFFAAVSLLKTVKLALRNDNFDGEDALAVAGAVDQTRVILEGCVSAQEKYLSDAGRERRDDLETIDTLFATYRQKRDALNGLAVDGDLPDDGPDFDAFEEAARMFLCYRCRTLDGSQHRVKIIQANRDIHDFLVNSDDFDLFLNSMSGDDGRRQ